MTSTMEPGLWHRYRAAYERMPPGMQLIGLQLWLPVFFVVAFSFCYVFAFHAPAPDHIPVAVVGDGPAATTLARQLEANSHGALAVTVQPSLAAARDRVRSGALAAAYQPGAGRDRLIVASGAQYQLAVLAEDVFAPVATAGHATLDVQDLAPLPARDSFGTSLFYLTLVWIISGYMSAMFVGMMGGGLRHRTRFAVIAGCSALLPLLGTVLVRFAVGAVDAHFWALWAIGSATALAVGLVVNGLAYFTGRFVTGFAMVLFVFANIPASGGAYPPELMPEPFRALHPVVVATGTIDLLRHTVYRVGPAAWQGWLLLAGYGFAGLLLSAVGLRYSRWRQDRHERRGGRPSMMFVAQTAAMAAAGSDPAAEPHDDGLGRVAEPRVGSGTVEGADVAALAAGAAGDP